MANTFQNSSILSKALEFTWKANSGFADKVTYKSDKFNQATKIGDSINFLRPQAPKVTRGDMGLDYSLPAIDAPAPFGISGMVDTKIPLTISQRFQYTIEASLEDLTLKTDKTEVMRNFVEPAIVNLRDQYNTYLAEVVARNAGQVNVAPTADGDGFMSALFGARAKMIFRKGLSTASAGKTLLINPNLVSTIGIANAKVFNANASNIYTKGDLGMLAGFEVDESPLMDTPVIAALGAGAITVDAGTAARPTQWQPSWTLSLTGLTNDSTVVAGTKIKIKTGSSYINWKSPVGADVGQVATFTVKSNALVSGTGTVTLTLVEPFIPTGNDANVMADLVPGTSTVELAYAVGTKAPSYAFANDSILAASPLINIPPGMIGASRLKFGGLNVLMFETPGPANNFQSVTQIVAFAGATVIKPEGICELHLS